MQAQAFLEHKDKGKYDFLSTEEIGKKAVRVLIENFSNTPAIKEQKGKKKLNMGKGIK